MPCSGSPARASRRVYAQKREALGTGNEDALYAVVNFENGAIGNLDYSWAWPDGLMNGFRSAFEIVGTRSAAALDVTDQGLYFVDDAATQGGDTHLWPEVNGRIAGALADELDHFIKATLAGTPYRQHYREAFDAIPVLDALARSAATGLARGCGAGSGRIGQQWLTMSDRFGSLLTASRTTRDEQHRRRRTSSPPFPPTSEPRPRSSIAPCCGPFATG